MTLKTPYTDDEVLCIAKEWVIVAKESKMLRGFALWKAVREGLRKRFKYERHGDAPRVMWY